MARRDLIEESTLLAAIQRNAVNPEAPMAMPLDAEAGEDGAGAAVGPVSAAEEADADDPIDAWLRFRPSGTSGE